MSGPDIPFFYITPLHTSLSPLCFISVLLSCLFVHISIYYVFMLSKNDREKE